jgi:peptide/nickel transport system ATP-binding protein
MNEPSKIILEVNDLSVSFKTLKGDVKVLDSIYFNVAKGEALGIVGESGCGKSVAAAALMGLIRYSNGYSTGDIYFLGKEISRLNEKQWMHLRGSGMSMIFQDPLIALNPLITCGKQVAEMLTQHNVCGYHDAKTRVIDLFKQIGIAYPERRYDQFPHELSGGMRQRVVIAMAIICEPELLIADEPTTALDVTIQAQILKLIRDLQTRKNMSMIFISHDIGVIREVADRIAVMYAGRICEIGSVTDVLNHPMHPYTQALIKAIPDLDNPAERLGVLKGMVPLPSEFAEGCRFYNRCDKATETCLKKPDLKELQSGHYVACFYAGESYE